MSPNPLYQALVEALESQLAPRVASAALREGLAAAGVTADTITHASAGSVLKGSVFHRLQSGGMSADAARIAVAEMDAYLHAIAPPDLGGAGPAAVGPAGADEPSDAESPSPDDGDEGDEPAGEAPTDVALDPATAEALGALQTALRPLNMYFAWAEVRKLRSLVQLASDEAGAGGDASSLISEADAQLLLVHQKLEDQLVLQARTLADLEAALEAVAPLGTPAVRRLDSLIATVRENHARRTLAEAETERAEKLARELRKLVESTVLDDGALPDLGRGDGRPRAPTPFATAAAATGDAAEDRLPADARDRLRALDVEGEVRDLEAMLMRHGELLRHVPALADEVAGLRAEHGVGRPVGARLGELDATWQAHAEARRQALRMEFEAVHGDVEAFRPEIDVTDLRRALTVGLDVLQDALPAIDDVSAVRELYAVAVAANQEANRRDQERAARHRDLRQQLDGVRERLAAAWRDSADEARLAPARVRLRAVLDAADSPVDTDERTAALLESVNDAEAAWERAVAEASDDQLERWRARTRELAARLAQLPDLANLRARTHAVRQEIVEAEARGDLDEHQVRALTHLVDQLIAEARAAVATRLDEIAREAGEPTPEALLRALQSAARQLDDGGFPDLEDVEREVQATRDERRAGTRRRYLRARQEAHRLADAGVESAATLAQLVGEARTAVEADVDGEAAVARLEERLALVERELDERMQAFDGRLDAALARFREVARLNNDDVAAVRRVLHHLDGQRDAVARVSPGLQSRLFEALSEAEAKLRGLRTAYEATREIADQLVSGNRIDDLLGSFDSLFGEDPPPAVPAAVDAPDPEAELAAWLDGYLALDEVAGAVVVRPDGQSMAGRGPDGTDLADVMDAISNGLAAWTALGEGMGDGPPELAQLDVGGRPAWVAPLEGQGYALVWSHEPSDGSAVGARLRDDRVAIAALLRGAHDGVASGAD